MGVIVESTHSYIDRDDLEQLVKHIIDQLISDV